MTLLAEKVLVNLSILIVQSDATSFSQTTISLKIVKQGFPEYDFPKCFFPKKSIG